MADSRPQEQSSLDSLFKMDTVRMEFEEDEDDHTLFLTSLARLGAGLRAEATGQRAAEQIPAE